MKGKGFFLFRRLWQTSNRVYQERMHRVRTGYRAEQDRKMREMETTIRWQEERIRQLEAELKRIKEDGRG